jgi:exo-1,4-beta-D-glucosaminidase
LWDDNYVTLLPGETRQLTARYRAANLQGATPSVRLSGWNVAATAIPWQ